MDGARVMENSPTSLTAANRRLPEKLVLETVLEELNKTNARRNTLLYRVRERELRLVSKYLSKTVISISKVKSIAQGIIKQRIVNGENAGEWENPFQISLASAAIPNDDRDAHFCGGSFLSSKHVVTAAHCVSGALSSAIQIIADSRRLDGSGNRLNIASISIHPNYSPSTLAYDIAIIELTDPAYYTYPVDIANRNPVANQDHLVTGWGALSQGGSTPVDLQALYISIVPTSVCNGPKSYDGDVTGTMLCAGYMAGGSDSCQGDSGGPLTGGIANTLLTGLVSWGIGCALPNYPGVYTRINHPTIRDFILSLVPPPVYPDVNPGFPYTIDSFGTSTNMFVRVLGTQTRRIWGTRKYADLKATADAYCQGIGFPEALWWNSNECGEDESTYVRYNPSSQQWESRNSGSSNNPGGYCLYPLMTSVTCAFGFALHGN